MESLLVTNILLLFITASILAVAITLIVLLAQLIAISRKIKNIATFFETNIARIQDIVSLFMKKPRKKAKKKSV